ncbi:MliC family protein [Celeribacter sp.]|uniref:MliC family protein n=1 Tax=Celeribacter sp. TaxID=1890673 RepID=UPI003A93237E
MKTSLRNAVRVSLLAGCLASAASGLFAQTPETTVAPDVITYTCERGVMVDVVYAGDVAVLRAEGRLVSLGQAVSASGARYVERPDGTGYQWWGKGNEARLTHLDAPDGDEVNLYTRCTAQP